MAKETKVHFYSSSSEWGLKVSVAEVRLPNNKTMPKAKVIFFSQGEYETSEDDVIKAIRKSPCYGVSVFESDKKLDDGFVDLVQDAVEERKQKLSKAGNATQAALIKAAKEVKEVAKKGTPSGGASKLAAAFKVGGGKK